MSRRKQTNPRAIKRDVSQDEDESFPSITKKLTTQSIRSDSVDSIQTIENEAKSFTIKCDSCQELFLTSEQFNQHRLYQCSFLLEETNSDESRVSSYEEYTHQIDTIPYGSSQNEEYPHPCSYCHKSFSNMALLLKHEQVHVELMPFRCSFCGKGFKHRRSLNRHLKLHTGERKFKCNLCESTFARSDHLKAHIRTHNNYNNNNTNQINHDIQLKMPTQSKSDVDEHTNSSETRSNKDDKKTEHCPYCPRVCLGEDSLRSHIQTEHSQSTTSTDSNHEQITTESQSPIPSDTYCHLCNAKFNNRENYYAHIRCTHPLFHPKLDPISLYSSLAVKNVSEKSTDSILNDYALIERTIWCEKCKHSFDSMTIYLQHYSFQHCLQIIKCLQCQDIFETLELFFNHIERTHPSKTVETLKCKLCNATYKQRSDFLHHIQTVHKTSSYICSLCSCQLNSMIELIDHLKSLHKIHQNFDLYSMNSRRPSFNTLFSCQYCSKKFPFKFDLNQHCLNEHDDEKKDSSSIDFRCSSCDLILPSEILLLEHNKHIHRSSSLSSSFQCTYCHASFTSRTQLDRHSRIHIASSGHNLKCNICDRLFSTVESLSEHKLSHCKATSSNLCSFCHQILTNEIDYTHHLYEHNQISTSKTKMNLSTTTTTTNENKPMTIICIVCKQSLINEHEIDLHAKFHLNHFLNKISDKDNSQVELILICHQCQRKSHTNRDYLLELSTFHLFCFNCIEKDLKCSDAHVISDNDVISTAALSCPKCPNNIEFDSMKTYQQHFTSVHLIKQSIDEYQCLKCNKIDASREHILQHQNKIASSSSGFLIDSIDSSRCCSSPPRVHYCYICRTNFDTAIKMHIHLLEHQYPNHEYQCSLCNQCSFDNASQLYHHMVQHGSKARLHPCRECDVYFMFSIHLINHQYSHDEDIVLKNCTSKKKYSMKSNDDDDNLCKSIVTRSASKRTCRSVIVS